MSEGYAGAIQAELNTLRARVAELEAAAGRSATGVTLSALAGRHILDAVDFSVGKALQCGELVDAQACRFRLDGVVYVAIEDPSDGYRSHLGELFIENDGDVSNIFTPCEVVGRHNVASGWRQDDILELIDINTGKTVLEVGTHNTDDYYPSFVACFSPQNMNSNISVAR